MHTSIHTYIIHVTAIITPVYVHGSCALSILIFCAGSENNCVRITANISTDNGVICPEATELTCQTFGLVGSAALRWTNENNVIIDALPVYNYQETDEFPMTLLAVNTSSDFVSYVIESADFNPSMRLVVNFTAVLVVNPELLLSSGHRILRCGGLTVTDNFTINQIDMEGVYRVSYSVTGIDYTSNCLSTVRLVGVVIN